MMDAMTLFKMNQAGFRDPSEVDKADKRLKKQLQSIEVSNAKITEKDIQQYRSNNWLCPPPPVCTVRWNEKDWIRYIKAEGVLYPKPE